MFFYQLGYNDYESHGCVNLCHEKEYTKEEWDAMVLEASKKAAKVSYDEQMTKHETEMKPYYLEEAEKAKAEENWYSYADEMSHAERPYLRMSYDDIYKKAAEILVADHGFGYVEFSQRTYLWGFSDLSLVGDKEEESESDMWNQLSEWVKENVCSRPRDHAHGMDQHYRQIEILREMGFDNKQIEIMRAKAMGYIKEGQTEEQYLLDQELLRAFGAEDDE